MEKQKSKGDFPGKHGGCAEFPEKSVYFHGGRVIQIEKVKKKVLCPYCGHEQKVQYAPDAECRGVFIRCQARHCKREFEIVIKQDK